MASLRRFLRRSPLLQLGLHYLRFGRRLDPLRVGHADALRFFERDRAAYERLIAAVAGDLAPRGVWLDVGANVGYFSRLLVERVGFGGELHAFEPLPHLAALCRETLRGLPCATTVHELGLSDTSGEATLYTAANGNIGWNTMVGEKRQPGMTAVTVRMRRFDQLDLPLPDFIKIDVEGAEHLVLAGMLPRLQAAAADRRRLPLLLCEVGWGRRHPQFAAAREVFAALAGLGYRSFDLDGKPLVIDDLVETTDVVLRL